MKFILTPTWDDGVAALTKRLSDELASGKKVLWLVSGGSNIAASVRIMNDLTETADLSVMLSDERFGPVGHKDSNWQQLIDAGFEAKQAKLLPTLQDGLDFEQTVKAWGQTVEQALSTADIVIAQLGIGPDGHVAGILPDSQAVQAKELVTGYQNEPYTRVTLTFPALKRLHAAYTFAFGEAKKPALAALKDQDLPLAQQPAQILKQLPEAYVYNDQVGDD